MRENSVELVIVHMNKGVHVSTVVDKVQMRIRIRSE